MSFYSPHNLVPYFNSVTGNQINGTTSQTGVNGQNVISTAPGISQINYLQLQLMHAAQQLKQQYQPLETCALCNQALPLYPIPLEFDNVARKQLYACSEICKNLWQAKKGPTEASNMADSRRRSPPRSHEDIKKTSKQANRKRKKKEISQQEKRKDQVDGSRSSQDTPISQVENQVNTVVNPNPDVIIEPLSEGRSSNSDSSVLSTTNQSLSNVEEPMEQAPILPIPQERLSNDKRDKMFVVVDTNCLIEHLMDIMKLKQHGYIILVIPMIVIQELDNIQKKEVDNLIGASSRAALKAILEGLRENQGQVKKWMRGQASYEVIPESSMGVPGQNNDDQIINCITYYKKYVLPTSTNSSASSENNKAACHLLLLTNDTALSVKSLMNGVPALNVQQFLQTLPPVSKYNDSWMPTLSYDELVEASTKLYDQPRSISSQVSTIPSNSTSSPTSSSAIIISATLGIPSSVWIYICKLCTPYSLLQLGKVNRFFYGLINGESSDDVFKTVLKRTFNDKDGILFHHAKGRIKDWYISWRRTTLSMEFVN